MANATPVVSPADVVIVVVCDQNADGTLSPALTPSATTPKVLPTNAQYVWIFNTQNADGSLSPTTV